MLRRALVLRSGHAGQLRGEVRVGAEALHRARRQLANRLGGLAELRRELGVADAVELRGHYLPDREAGKRWVGKKTLREWQSLNKHLEAGRAWPIGLVGTTEDPTQNHQVVACACDEPGDGTQVIAVYDPNCPGEVRLIKFRFQAERFQVMQEDCAPGARGPLQGFFCEQYRAHPAPPRVSWP